MKIKYLKIPIVKLIFHHIEKEVVVVAVQALLNMKIKINH